MRMRRSARFDADSDGSSVDSSRTHKVLGIWSLVALIYFNVSGGPFGSEEAVEYGGVQLALVLFLVMPLVWSVPEAFITAELASTFPENSGFVTWVGAAFGPFWGFMEGCFSWCSSVADNAIYPKLFMTYLITTSNNAFGPHEWWMTLALCVFLIYLNFRGLNVVANMTIMFAVVTIVPFIVVGLFAIPSIEPRNWTQPHRHEIQWAPLFNNLFWNLNYWDTVSTVAGEVRDPRKIPQACRWALIIVVMVYFVPLLIGTGVCALDRGGAWKMGYYSKVAEVTGQKFWNDEFGILLMVTVVISSAVSNLGQFQSELCSGSYQVQGMAEDGWIPAFFARKSRHNTPSVGIALSAVIILVASQFDVNTIITCLNLPYCFAALLEFAAFLKLRWSHPDLHRPYRIPLPFWACCLMLVPASSFVVFLIIMNFVTGNTLALGFLAAVAVSSVTLYRVSNVLRARSLARFLRNPRTRNFSDDLSTNSSELDLLERSGREILCSLTDVK